MQKRYRILLYPISPYMVLYFFYYYSSS